MTRYSNQLKIDGFSQVHQQKLASTKVLVVGAGGLGCPLLINLAQMGIGHITILDDDKIEESNLNRQSLFKEVDIGRLKAQAAAKSLTQLNSNLSINAITERLISKNAHYFVSNHDIVADCTDNLAARYALDHACAELKIPLVFAGIRKYEGQIGVFNGESGIKFSAVFPASNETFQQEDCEMLGTFGFVANTIGSLQSIEIFKLATGLGSVLLGKVMHLDLLENRKLIIDQNNSK